MKQVIIPQPTADELDVTLLLQKAISFFGHYGKLLTGVALAGILLGVLLYRLQPNVYNSSLILQPAMLSDPEHIELINNWQSLLKKKEYPVLAQQLGTDARLLKKIKTISAEEIQKSYSPGNFTAFSLTVGVTDTAILPSLQRGILYGIDNSAYLKDKLAARKNILRSLIVTTGQEIGRLQSMQSTVETNMQTANSSTGHFIVDVSAIGSQIAALEEKKLSYEENLQFTSAVHVLQGFFAPTRPDQPKLIKLLLMGFAAGLVAGNAIALYLHVRAKMKAPAYTNKQPL